MRWHFFFITNSHLKKLINKNIVRAAGTDEWHFGGGFFHCGPNGVTNFHHGRSEAVGVRSRQITSDFFLKRFYIYIYIIKVKWLEWCFQPFLLPP